MSFDILALDTPPFSKPEEALGILTNAWNAHAVAAMRLDARLRATTHFYHGVGLDIDNNKRWYVIAHLGGQHATTATTETWYGEHGADPDEPLDDDVRKEAETYVYDLLRADFFTVLGLEKFIP